MMLRTAMYTGTYESQMAVLWEDFIQYCEKNKLDITKELARRTPSYQLTLKALDHD